MSWRVNVTISRSSAGSVPGSPFARSRSMASSRTPFLRAAATWAAHTYAASRSRTAVRMARERSFGATMLSSRKKVTRGSTRSASFGLWSSMLNGPRTVPNTFTTASTTAWCSADTSDLPVIGATRGITGSFLASHEQRQGLLDELGEGAQKLGAARAVEGTVVAGQGQHHGGLDDRLAVDGDDPVGDAADGKDGGLGRIDDGSEGVDAVHPEVADREAAALD